MENLFELIKYILLGLFQGITEPIPVSSSGHLEIAEHFFGLEIQGMSFALLVNTASLLAVLLIYKDDIQRLIVNGLAYLKSKDPEAKSDFMFIIYLIIGTIPAGVIGILFGEFIEDNLASIKTVGITLLVTGLALWIIRNMRGRKSDGELSYRDAIIVGLAQAV